MVSCRSRRMFPAALVALVILSAHPSAAHEAGDGHGHSHGEASAAPQHGADHAVEKGAIGVALILGTFGLWGLLRRMSGNRGA